MTPSARPPRSNLDPEQVPADLRDLRHWVCWQYAWDDDRWTKVPMKAVGRGKASTIKPKSWVSFEEAVARFHADEDLDGVGFVFSADDPFTGIDLDNSLERGELKPWARLLVERFGTYTEISPSGKGVKLWARGSLPPGSRGRRRAFEDGAVEVYSEKRFFTVTGQRHHESPAGIADRQADLEAVYAELWPAKPRVQNSRKVREVIPDDDTIIDRAGKAKNGDRFRRLWEGDTSDYPSQSEADLALCNHLAFYCGRNPTHMDRLFRRSGLYRDKWDRSDYREETIRKAIEGCTEVYDGGRNGRARLTGRGDSGPAEHPDPPPLPRLTGPEGVTIEVLQVSVTSSRATVRMAVSVEGYSGEVTATNTGSGQRDLADHLAEVLGKTDLETKRQLRLWVSSTFLRDNIDDWARILDQRAEARSAGADEGPGSAVSITLEYLRERLSPAFLTPDGAMWSEARGRPLSRQEVLAAVDAELLSRLKGCPDVPKGAFGAALVPAAERALRAVWGELGREMPDELRADLGPDSRAAAAALDRLRVIFNTPDVWRRDAAEGFAVKTTIADLCHHRLEMSNRGWVSVGHGLGLFVRLGEDASPAIALRPETWRLAVRGLPLSAARSVSDLRRLLVGYGLAETDSTPIRANHLVTRAVVLSPEVSRALLKGGDPGDADPGADGGVNDDR